MNMPGETKRTHETGMAMRTLGEGDRSPGFREARDALVADSAEWLEGMVRAGQEGIVGTRPLTTTTQLGSLPSRPWLSLIGTSSQYGESAWAEESGRPRYERLAEDPTTRVVTRAWASGTHPLWRMVNKGDFTDGHRDEEVLGFGVEISDSDGILSVVGYWVYGDGSVFESRFGRGDSTTHRGPLFGQSEVEAAHVLFKEQIVGPSNQPA